MIHGEPSLEGFSMNQMNRHGLHSDQFARIKKLLPGRPGSVGRDSQLGNRALRRGCDLEVSDRRSLARYAGAFRRLEERSHALFPLGEEGDLGESF